MRITRADAHLHARISGRRGQTPLIFLHGLGGSGASWNGSIGGLSDSHTVIVPDLRGCGASETGSDFYSLRLLADDVVAWMDVLGIKSCHLIGHSFGAVVAQEVLTKHNSRVRSAMLVSTSSRVGPQAADNWLRLAAAVRKNGLRASPKASARAFSENFANTHPELVRSQSELTTRSAPDVYAAQAEAAARYDYTEALAAVVQPVLVMQGKEDRMTPVGGSVLLARALPNAKLELIEGVGHNLHLELGPSFAQRIADFVAEVD